ncbi:MAG: branched-chain amino acid ABC transporter permease [Sneathiella sp.]|uniref:branched-chain amino acid ABC transporter permease n=1 Tax=Sneathiella sp. TaxID=1964365 RepID=UPI000C5ABF67|nr:branched-chain amino acid ABC transporter permease [Sneathiella sp.]MAZ04492.1 branched-chain amino acid ABC transporter permease [Sneathiella sp.]|tara:strand:- start:789 stop:1862 length:1074 start_codon:yes stop_codon:yes gene_type:complete
MFYRQAGIRHRSYVSDSKLFPIPTDRNLIWFLVLLGIIAPLVVDSLYLNSYVLPWLIWTAAALGLNLVTGWAGQLHLGYAAIMAVGAYSAVHAARFGVPWEFALLIAGVSAAAIGTVFSFAAMRVKGLYLALTTLAMQFVMDWVLSHVPAVTGGSHASLQSPTFKLLGQPITSDAGLYYVAFGWCVIVTIFILNMRRTGLGRALVAVREKDYAAAILGVNSFYYKIVAFATSSFIAGISGALLVATFFFLATPEQFSVNVSIQVLAMVIVGGLASIIGSYFGVALILLMPGITNSLFSAFADYLGLQLNPETLAHIPTAVYGALIIIFLMVEPLGLGKIYNNIRDYFLVWPFDQMKK